MKSDELLKGISSAVANEDMDELLRLKLQFVEGTNTRYPFQPNVRLQGQNPDEPMEGDVAMAAANGWSRAYRSIIFKRRMRQGYSGPIIVSEGDSWFQYPILLKDVIDNLMEPFAICSLGAAGDTLSNMIAQAEYRKAIAEHGADVFLFSASGNDVLGNGDLAALLKPFEPGMELGDIVRAEAVERTLTTIEEGYDTVVREALSVRSTLRIFVHGYDRPYPRSGGQWLGRPMEHLGVPTALHAAIAALLIDKLNERLEVLEARHPGRVHHIDCRGRVGGSVNSWYDELHPRNPGYARVAALFEARIRATDPVARIVVTPGLARIVPGEPVTPVDLDLAVLEMAATEEALVDDPRPVRGHEGRTNPLSRKDLEILEEYRTVLHDFSAPDQQKRLRARRHMVPDDDDRAFERILGDSNLFPINFLSRGARKAAAVAKVQLFVRGEIPSGSGSGFLVGPGLLLTNNHVISSRDAARRAKAIFNYQDDDNFRPMSTQTFDITDDVFFTSPSSELDFTFVSVRAQNDAGNDLSRFDTFTLIEESGKAVKGEPVSIIQHPRGDRKSIALRDSTIIGVKGNFIYYSTDTEPGSSGAPVLNDQWLPVALHHRSVPHPEIPEKWIANRGIRISQILRVLREAAASGDQDAVSILQLVGVDPVERPDPLVAPVGPLRKREDAFVPSLVPVTPAGEIGVTDETFRRERWDGVEGYDPDFLNHRFKLPLPPHGQGVREVDGRPDLPYKHFSIVMHADRKLAMLAACNTDGNSLRRLRRSGEWRVDPRIPPNAQVDNRAYSNNDYDRGHLVRRLAPMWGSEADARMAMADTFHYTVCAPQHARLNQGIWLNLEDYLLNWAEEHGARMSIFTGPIFRADDPSYRGIVRVPADYWKVAVAGIANSLRAVAYLHTQKNLIPTVNEAFGDYRTHRVPVHIIGDLTGLDFGAFEAFDVAGEFESLSAPREIKGREDIGF